MFTRISRLFDDHPSLYLAAGAFFLWASLRNTGNAQDMIARYHSATRISREVSESLGG